MMSEQDSPGRPPVADDQVPAGYVDVSKYLEEDDDSGLGSFVRRAVSEEKLARPYYKLGTSCHIHAEDMRRLNGLHEMSAYGLSGFGEKLCDILTPRVAANHIESIRESLQLNDQWWESIQQFEYSQTYGPAFPHARRKESRDE